MSIFAKGKFILSTWSSGHAYPESRPEMHTTTARMFEAAQMPAIAAACGDVAGHGGTDDCA